MNDFLTLVINPEGTRQTVTIADAIRIKEEIDGKYVYHNKDVKIRSKELERNRIKARRRYKRIKADPVKYAALKEKRRLSRTVKEHKFK